MSWKIQNFSLSRQFDQYASKFAKAGFREALEDESVNEEILQEAFDEGYEIGYKISLEFNSLCFTLRLIEGMYEENRLEVSQDSKAHLEKLHLFNTKLEELRKRILSDDILSVEKVDNAKEIIIYDKWKQYVNIAELKSEATEILNQLECSIPI